MLQKRREDFPDRPTVEQRKKRHHLSGKRNNNQTIIDFQKFKERITLLNEVYNIKDKAPHIRYVLYKETY